MCEAIYSEPKRDPQVMLEKPVDWAAEPGISKHRASRDELIGASVVISHQQVRASSSSGGGPEKPSKTVRRDL